jgi:hypothetical protein
MEGYSIQKVYNPLFEKLEHFQNAPTSPARFRPYLHPCPVPIGPHDGKRGGKKGGYIGVRIVV